MSNRSCATRRSITREPSRNSTRRSESNRRGIQRASSCNNIEPIQEECDKLEMIEEEHECENLEQEPRYDPKELRDVVKILSPFVRLIEDTKNPYARIVAREVCKTFYRLFHPDVHPADVIKSINWKSKIQRSGQLWNEFWLYVPGGNIKDWVPLVNREKEDTLVDPNGCNSYQPQNFRLQQDHQTSNNFDINEFINHENGSPEMASAYHACNSNDWNLSNERPPDDYYPSIGQSPESSEFTEDANNMCASMERNTCGDIDPSEIMCDHQTAGSDSLAYASSNFLSNKDQNKYISELVETQISDQISDNKKQLPEHEKKNCFIISENATTENELINDTTNQISPNRQTAGNDQVNIPYCEQGSSSDPPRYTDNPNQYEYYRITGNTSTTSRQTQDSPIEPELRTNVLDNNVINNEECNDSDSFESVKGLGVNQIACNASMVANAFTNLTLASNELKKKKEAFKKLTHSYLNVASKSSELDPSLEYNAGAQIIPSKINPFDDHEWNDDAFKDRDFIRILPFYESIHNELEYISKEQRGYGYNMLDDIMSTLYHIHYELGDPRLKNDMLVDHVKLITANTWEAYFYKGNKKMPAIPDPYTAYSSQPNPEQSNTTNQRQPCPGSSSLRESAPRELPPRELCPREPSPREPCPREPTAREQCPKPPVHRRPSVLRQAAPSRGSVANASANVNYKPQSRTTSRRRMADAPQQNENPIPETQTRKK